MPSQTELEFFPSCLKFYHVSKDLLGVIFVGICRWWSASVQTLVHLLEYIVLGSHGMGGASLVDM